VVSCVNVDPTNEAHLLVTYSNYGVAHIIETKNATAATPTWTDVSGNLPDMPVRWSLFYPGDPTKAIIATELGVWTTDLINGTSTVWDPTNTGLANVQVDMLKYRAADKTVAAATHGRGVFTTTLPTPAATLSALTISSGKLAPAFTSATLSYADTVSNSISTVTVKPTATDTAATIKVNGTIVASGTASAAISLTTGTNTITIAVTSSDNSTTDTYTIAVNRLKPANAALTGLTAKGVTLSPAFKFSTFAYTSTVSTGTSSTIITPTASDPAATITVNGVTVASGTASAALPLSVGQNVITVVCTAQNGTTKDTYTLTITRQPSNNDNLSNLHLSKGTPSPAFNAATTSYTANVANTVTSITVTPTAAIAGETITVNGTAVASGTASGAIALNEGANPIATVVTAPDGVTTKTYTVTVTRAGNNNDNLSSLKVSRGTLTPAFSTTTTSYTASVVNGVTSMTVTPTAADAGATITVNSTAVASGTASPAIALAVGSNTVDVNVTASNGTTQKVYAITVTRAASGADAYGPGVSVTGPAQALALANDGIQVHSGVSPNGDGINDFLVIDGIKLYPDNKLMIMDRSGQLIFETKGYDNSSKVFDGHSNKTGQMQLPGTYFYQLDYTVKGVVKHKTGFIVLKY